MNIDSKAAAQAALKKYGSLHKCAKALGMPRSTFRLRLRGVLPKSGAARPAAPLPRSSNGRSLQDFRAEHDKDFIVPRKIREALKLLGGGWEYEAQFAKLAGVSLADLGNYRDAFSEHVVPLRRDGKRAWAATAAVAARMREMVS